MSFDDVIDLLYEIGSELGFDPTFLPENELFLRDLLSGIKMLNETSLRKLLEQKYRCISTRPDWIQSEAWPISDGKPMVFVGQIDVPYNKGASFFHDEASFYVFWSPETGKTEVIIQVS